MSKEQIQAFGKKVSETPALLDEVKAVGQDVDSIVALGQREGFDFTAEELVAAAQEAAGGDEEQLSDAELEEISGGTGFIPSFLGIGCL